MKIKEYFDEATKFSDNASTLNRQLGFTALALVWVFKSGNDANNFTVPDGLIIPSFLAVASLTFDMIHYWVGAIMWRNLGKRYEDKTPVKDRPTKEFTHSAWRDMVVSLLFFVKIACIVACYILILFFLKDKFHLRTLFTGGRDFG